jgi:hypothetical protein
MEPVMNIQSQHVSRDAVFVSLFASLDEEDADIGTAYLTSCAQGVSRNRLASEVFPHSALKAEYQGLTVAALFNVYMRGHQNVSAAQEMVLQRKLRRTN